jgi:hypothetical protein
MTELPPQLPPLTAIQRETLFHARYDEDGPGEPAQLIAATAVLPWQEFDLSARLVVSGRAEVATIVGRATT